MSVPFFSKAFGKGAGDLAKKDFYNKKEAPVKTTFKTSTAAGVTVEATGKNLGGTPGFDVTSTFGHEGTEVVGTWNTKNDFTLEMSCNDKTHGVEGLDLSADLDTNEEYNFEASYKMDNFSGVLTGAYSEETMGVTLSAVTGADGATVGIQAETQVTGENSPKISKVSAGLAYTEKKNFDISLKGDFDLGEEKKKNFTFGFLHYVLPDFTWAAKVDTEGVDLTELKTTVTVASEYKANKETKFKAKIDSTSMLDLAWVQNVSPETKLTGNVSYSIQQPSDSKIGLSAVFEV